LQLQQTDFVGRLTESTGQRSDLTIDALCAESACYHGKFLVKDQQGRTAGIVITKEDRLLRLKTPDNPALAPVDERVAGDYKQGKPVVVTSTEIFPGRSYYDIKEKTANPSAQGLQLKGDLVEPGGDCVQVDNSQSQYSQTCLIGNDEQGDLLFKLQLKDSTPEQTATPPANSSSSKSKPRNSQKPAQKPAGSSEKPNTKPSAKPPKPALYLELARDERPAENGPTTTTTIPVNRVNCRVTSASNNSMIQDIMKDCGNTEIEKYTKIWATGVRGKWLKNFLHYNEIRLHGDSSATKAELGKAGDLKTMLSVLAQYNFPEIWAVISVHESAGFINQTKPASHGEIGYWQLLPATAAGFGLKVYPTVTRAKDDRLNVSKATTAAIRYYNGLLTMWAGDVKMAMASYNRGEGTMDKASKNLQVQINQGHINVGDDLREAAAISKDFWYIYHHHMLNKKEHNWEYVPIILAGMFVAAAPDAYGLQGATPMGMQ
jgi:hypothetical protein